MTIHDMTVQQIQQWLKPRPLNANKGDFGHVLVIGGDHGMAGAVRMAGESAARTGAGLVTVVTRPTHVPIVLAGRPELLCYGIDTLNHDLDILIARATIIVLGPGLGQSDWSLRLFIASLNTNKLTLLDADGLNWLAQQQQFSTRNNWILTPHPGEASRLLDCSIHDIQADRQRAVTQIQAKYGGVAILKGTGTLIATGKAIYRCPAGNPGMASGGMGDVLSGIIGGLLAQGLSPAEAAQAGVMVHAIAGDRVARKRGQRGMLATDLLQELPELLNH